MRRELTSRRRGSVREDALSAQRTARERRRERRKGLTMGQVLITGGTGALGSAVTRRFLEDGHHFAPWSLGRGTRLPHDRRRTRRRTATPASAAPRPRGGAPAASADADQRRPAEIWGQHRWDQDLPPRASLPDAPSWLALPGSALHGGAAHDELMLSSDRLGQQGRPSQRQAPQTGQGQITPAGSPRSRLSASSSWVMLVGGAGRRTGGSMGPAGLRRTMAGR